MIAKRGRRHPTPRSRPINCTNNIWGNCVKDVWCFLCLVIAICFLMTLIAVLFYFFGIETPA